MPTTCSRSSQRRKSHQRALIAVNYAALISKAACMAAKVHGVPASFLIADALEVSDLGSRRIDVSFGHDFCRTRPQVRHDHPVLVTAYHHDDDEALRIHFDAYAAAIAYRFPKALALRSNPYKFVRAICIPHAAGDYVRAHRLETIIQALNLKELYDEAGDEN